ncbi:hypothetical protein, partial [Paraburkholderia sp. SIMBA_030]|uniref:hypothetical protein n=1 Tax=Paraburkholderia sp. SIMBA_030 TaxID=3085773 RepID=UPI00397E8CE3
RRDGSGSVAAPGVAPGCAARPLAPLTRSFSGPAAAAPTLAVPHPIAPTHRTSRPHTQFDS